MSATNGTSLNSMSYDQLRAELDRVNALLAAKPAAKAPELQFSVGQKGGLCVIGLNSGYPVTLYWDQWLKLIAVIENHRLQDFAKANMARLKMKPVGE